MNRVTVIVVPDGQSRVRRFQVPARLLRNGLVGAAVFGVVLAAGVADWVRLRRTAWDVDVLRAEAVRDQTRLVALARELRGLEEKVGELGEFERKIRLIADLPAALPETRVPARLGAAELRRGGQGGPDDGEDADVAAPALPAPPAAEAPVEPRPPGPRIGLDDAALDRMGARAERLATELEGKDDVFARLAERLRGLRDRLASTPSIWPTNGFVTSHFGWRISPFTGRRQFHKGLDISADLGSAIVAVARGRVVFAGPKGSFGQAVVLDHGFGYRTTYAHASALYVKAGQTVERGERLAAVGSTGRSTAPHLHYAVSVKGRSANPTDYILD